MSSAQRIPLATLLFSIVILCIVSVLIPACSKPDVRESGMNLDFESRGASGVPQYWEHHGPAYHSELDSAVVYAGARSLKLEGFPRTGAGVHGACTTIFPVEDALGKRVSFAAYVRTKDLEGGDAHLWMQIGRGAMEDPVQLTSSERISGSTGWTKCAITTFIEPSVTSLELGASIDGRGTAWFDHGELTVDDQPYVFRARVNEPSSGTLDWLRAATVRLSGDVETCDMEAVAHMSEGAGVVGLGETVNGTHELTALRSTIIRRLVTGGKISAIVIEASMPDVYALNRYVMTGEGDPAACLRNLRYWPYVSGEMRSFVQWLRSYNATAPEKISIWGCDIQFPDVSVDEVKRFFDAVDPTYAFVAREAYQRAYAYLPARAFSGTPPTNEQLQNFAADLAAVQSIRVHLADMRANMLLQKKSTTAIDAIVQNASILEQCLLSNSPYPMSMDRRAALRDSAMAANTMWVLSRQPKGAGIILCGHASHLRRIAGRMGDYLHAALGAAYRPIVLTCDNGSASGSTAATKLRIDTAMRGSMEWMFRRAGIASGVLDMRGADENASWLSRSCDVHWMGASAYPGSMQTTTLRPRLEFDAVIDVENVNAAVRLE